MQKLYQCIESTKTVLCQSVSYNPGYVEGTLISIPDYVPDLFDPLVLSWKVKKPVIVFKPSNPTPINGEGAVWDASRISILGKAT